MGRENKNEAVAALHRARILAAAERMFTERGFAQTTIDDISKASAYSRRTIYAYYENKEDLLHHIVAKGLEQLKEDLTAALEASKDFLTRYDGICKAVGRYQRECPHSLEQVTRARTGGLDPEACSPAVRRIFALGTEINELLAAWLRDGQAQGAVRQELAPMPSVYVLWTGLTALFTLVQTKGAFLSRAFGMSEDAFLAYGLDQIVHSVLEVN